MFGKQLIPNWQARLAKRTPKRVSVKWVDACMSAFENLSLRPGWMDNYENGVICEHIGFLLKKDNKFITLGWEFNHDTGIPRHIQDIPTYSVVELKELK